MNINEQFLKPEEVANWIGVTAKTLAVWRSEGRYNLKFVKVGGRVLYPQSEVLKFLESRLMSQTQ
ncbi:helix-turn-helix domain-containing protein [Litorilituus lipolyticus]|uniref:helix-turn-helix domain-containing protein n=1 Tax=Litorilituus lipolyticus TaxID=2491017 RepID=UPI001FE77775|nr:helix-turn-helix domain-containing protein [Litorilituus lipolyticus]